MTLNIKIELEEEEAMIKREQFLTIWGFMLTDLKLEKTELLVYAVIFSMHKNYCEGFNGSRKYLQQWCNAGKTAVDSALKSLVSKNLLRKEYKQYGQLKKAVYYINTDALPTCEMFDLENRHGDISKKIRVESSIN